MGPDFQVPPTEVPEEWSGNASDDKTSPAPLSDKDLTDWWLVFNDPALAALVERAVASNLDLKQAEARIRQARAARGIVASDLGPSMDARASYERSRFPEAGDVSGGVVTDQYQTGFDALWELDFFGGVRRSIEAADADLQSSIENRRDVLVTLTAEVARNYIELREFQQRTVIARQNLKAQEHNIELTRQRFQYGFVSGLDVANAQAQAATTSAQIPLLEASARQSIYNLSILLGREPAALIQEMSGESAVPEAPPAPPAGLPSDLLLRRPDIRKAYAQVHAATARIGVAESDLYPRFMITGSLVIGASNPGSSLDWDNRIWSFGPSVSLPVFDSGRIRSNIKLREALNEQEIIAYQQTVLSALKEVEDALIACAKEQERRDALVSAVSFNRKAVDLSTTLYVQGETDFLSVLQAQRALLITEELLAQSSSALSSNLVALYKALGGGWAESPDME
ncbi:MAG: efflux transporter outer membrane subunit [Desulfobacterales bacterium]|nr:efflux transporter outer membrane subunit [Desulfobacterales bacterium]